MRIVRTLLVNVCQHERQQVEFASGLVGLFGRNGIGKSNLLKMGAYANLTNDFSRNNKPKAQNVRYQAGDNAKSYIETEWEHDGHSFVIIRGLQNPKRDTLRADLLPESVHKDGEIDEWVAKLTGLPNYRYLADNYVFVDQNQLTSFLSEDPASRAKGFANLCGTTVAEACWVALGEQLTKDAAHATDVLDNSDELRQQLGDYKTLLAEASAALEVAKARVLSPERTKAYQARVDAVAKRAELRGRLAKERTLLASAAAEAQASRDAVVSADADLANAVEKADGAEGRLERARARIARLAGDTKAYAAKQKLADELQSLTKPAAPKALISIEGIEREQAANGMILSETTLELNKAREILAKLGKKNLVECPTCGTPVTAMHEHLAQLRKVVEEYPGRVTELQKTQEKYASMLRTARAYEAEVRSYEERKTWLTRQLEAQADVQQPADDMAALLQQEKRNVALLDRVRQCKEFLAEVKQDLAADSATRKAARAAVQALREQLAELGPIDKEKVLTARKKLKRSRAAALEVATLTERVKHAKAGIKQKEAELETLQRRIAQTAKMREWTKLLQEMRGVLHRDRLPQLVHEGYQQQLLPDANAMLERFRQPFTLDAAPGLNFIVTKPDGTVEQADGLSGGEQVVLALAIRWAVHSLSAAGLGMLVLDEPTAGLDKANLRYLREALPQLGAEARSRGLQVIVVTHESELKSVFDQVIELT